MNVYFETPADMWISVTIAAFTLVFVFLAFRLWEARDAVANFIRVVKETWRKLQTDDFTEYEIRKEIQYQRSQGNDRAARHWVERLERMYPKKED